MKLSRIQRAQKMLCRTAIKHHMDELKRLRKLLYPVRVVPGVGGAWLYIS